MRTWTFLMVGSLAATPFGCGGALHPEPSSTVVPISTFEQISGKWEGLSKHVPDMRDHASVLLIIREKGYFNFVSNRGTGLLLGTGTLHIQNGKVFAKTDSGTGMFTLHDKASKPVLVAEVALNDGNHYYLVMTPLR